MKIQIAHGQVIELTPRLFLVTYAGPKSLYKRRTGWTDLCGSMVSACTAEEAVEKVKAKRPVVCLECVAPDPGNWDYVCDGADVVTKFEGAKEETLDSLRSPAGEGANCPHWHDGCDSDLGGSCPPGASCPANQGAERKGTPLTKGTEGSL